MATRKVTVIPAKRANVEAKNDTNEKIRVAAYCRVSTEAEEQLNSFENQVEYYTNYIEGNPNYINAGIFSDEGITGTNTKKRKGFNSLIKACDDGLVDLVITKSISRFARNTKDCLEYSRHLKRLNIPIIFEKENINTMETTGELLFTILSSLAQEESRNISENSKWGIRSNFEKGRPLLRYSSFLGYDLGEDGNMVVNKEQAEIVKRVFKMFEEGLSFRNIADVLNEEGVTGVQGKVAWHAITIEGMLRQEKYCGDVLMQKTFSKDYLSKKRVKNRGELAQYYVQDHHEAIIPREEWEAVQLELSRRAEFRNEHGIAQYGGKTPFTMHIYDSATGIVYMRQYWSSSGVTYWHKKGYHKVKDSIPEERLYKAFRIAWNSIVKEKNENILRWETMIAEGDPLERMRARQMISLVEEGEITCDVPELITMTLESILVEGTNTFVVTLLDGTSIKVCV